MNNRPYRRRTNETEAGKNSFFASPPRDTQPQANVKSAIDESLYAVRFNAQDARSVMKAVRGGQKKKSARKKRSRMIPDFVLAFSVVMLIALPVSLYAIRSRESITTITAAPGLPTATPAVLAAQNEDVVSTLATQAPTAQPHEEQFSGVSESEAIQIARECFETHCDTSIFTFDEYEVQVTRSDENAAQYTVTLSSIYQNGCSFSVVISCETGDVLQYSSPRLATVPAFVDNDSPEVRAWYDKYGEHLFTWPQDIQAEFSRRYQGATLRASKEDEISYEAARSAVSGPIASEAPGLFTAFYPVLYSERASANGAAYYVVYCYAEEVTDTLPESDPMIVSFDAKTGDILSIEGNPLDRPISLQPVLQSE